MNGIVESGTDKIGLLENFFPTDAQTVDTGEAKLSFLKVKTDKPTVIFSKQVDDCIPVIMWGKTRDDNEFIALVHNTAGSNLSQTLKENNIIIPPGEVGYRIEPGKGSDDKAVRLLEEECSQLFKDKIPTKNIPSIIRIKSPYQNNKANISVRQNAGGPVEIMIVEPNIG